MVCYDITSKQSLLSLYEEKKMGYEDLQMILGGFVQVMEDMSEYLLNPCRLVLKPEYMYVDVEKRQIYFCYLPGYDEDVRQKFQELTEYILPRLDHEDQKAVSWDMEYIEGLLKIHFIWNMSKKSCIRKEKNQEKRIWMRNCRKRKLKIFRLLCRKIHKRFQNQIWNFYGERNRKHSLGLPQNPVLPEPQNVCGK